MLRSRLKQERSQKVRLSHRSVLFLPVSLIDDLYNALLKYVFTNVAPQADFTAIKVRDEVSTAMDRFCFCFDLSFNHDS